MNINGLKSGTEGTAEDAEKDVEDAEEEETGAEAEAAAGGCIARSKAVMSKGAG